MGQGSSRNRQNQGSSSNRQNQGSSYWPVTPNEFLNAAKNGGAEGLTTVNRYIQENGDINTTNDDGQTALMLAAKNNHIAIVTALLASNSIKINAHDRNKKTALFSAAAGGYISIVIALLAKDGIVVNAMTDKGDTPLIGAAFHGYTLVVKALLQKLTLQEITKQSYEKEWIMTRTDYYGRSQVVGRRIQYYNAEEESNGETGELIRARVKELEFIEAVKSGDDAVGEYIRSNHNNVPANATNSLGSTALMFAAHYGYSAIVNMLLPRLTLEEITTKCNQHRTAAEYAQSSAHPEIAALIEARVEALRFIEAAKSGGDVGLAAVKLYIQEKRGRYIKLNDNIALAINSVDLNGDTALIGAAINGHTVIVTDLLAEDGIDVNAANKAGETALISAVNKGDLTIVTALLEDKVGINVNAANKAGETALISAVNKGYLTIVTALLEDKVGINVDAANKAGDTALISAVNKGEIKIVTALLVKVGIDINAANKAGDTALISAVNKGEIKIVTALLAKVGIAVNAANRAGDTALILAANLGRTAIVKALLPRLTLEEITYENFDHFNAAKCARSHAHPEIAALIEARVEALRFIEAAKSGGDAGLLSVKWYIQQNGNAINVADKFGKTALIWAASIGHIDIVTTLLSRLTLEEITKEHNDHRTAAQEAESNGHPDIAALIVARIEALQAAANLFAVHQENNKFIEAAVSSLNEEKEQANDSVVLADSSSVVSSVHQVNSFIRSGKQEQTGSSVDTLFKAKKLVQERSLHDNAVIGPLQNQQSVATAFVSADQETDLDRHIRDIVFFGSPIKQRSNQRSDVIASESKSAESSVGHLSPTASGARQKSCYIG